MVYYLINIKNSSLFYGKENSINGRILQINTTDSQFLPYIIAEIGYKSQQGAIKGARKLQREKGLKASDIKIDGVIIE